MPDESKDQSRKPIYDQPPDRSEVWEGLLFALGAMIAFVAAMVAIASSRSALVAPIVVPALFACGVSQLIYIVPLAVALRHFGRNKAAKGVIIFAALIFILNATCWGIVMGLSRR
jgi:hypothetical protein